MLANKRHQLLGRYQESNRINKTEQSQNDETREPIRISGREKSLEKTFIVHYSTLVPEAHSIRNRDSSLRIRELPGGRFELRPTPKAFEAALLRGFLTSEPLQVVNGKLRIFLSF